jgi:hypothetical protein
MSFTYIEVADDKPYVTQNPNFLSRVMSKLPFSRGGKSKKRKSKKRKSKKRKTRKRY